MTCRKLENTFAKRAALLLTQSERMDSEHAWKERKGQNELVLSQMCECALVGL